MDLVEIFKVLPNKLRLQMLLWLKLPELYFHEVALAQLKTKMPPETFFSSNLH